MIEPIIMIIVSGSRHRPKTDYDSIMWVQRGFAFLCFPIIKSLEIMVYSKTEIECGFKVVSMTEKRDSYSCGICVKVDYVYIKATRQRVSVMTW